MATFHSSNLIETRRCWSSLPEEERTLKSLDLIVLDNSLNELPLGQKDDLNLENKIKIFKEVKKCGFKSVIVADFNGSNNKGNAFCEWLIKEKEKNAGFFAFVQGAEKIHDGQICRTSVSASLLKCKVYGIQNVIIDFDFSDKRINWSKNHTIESICEYLLGLFNWCSQNLSEKSCILLKFNNFSGTMSTVDGHLRILSIVQYLSSLQTHIQGICLEDSGKYLPEQVAEWCATLRKAMDSKGWKHGKILIHVHKEWGMAQSSQMECLMKGAVNGVYAGLREEWGSVGHASSTLTILNLTRLGNVNILKHFNCAHIRQAATKVTKIASKNDSIPSELIYGEGALDLWLPTSLKLHKDFDVSNYLYHTAASLKSLPVTDNRWAIYAREGF